MPEFDYEKWVKDIERLKKNRQQVPEDVLKTRYAGPYNRLIKEIDAQTEAMTKWILFTGLPVMVDWEDEEFPEDKKDVEVLITRICSTIELAKVSGETRRIRQAATSECNPDKAMELTERIRDAIEREAYMPYWHKHCSLQENGRVIYNDLIGMKWWKDNIWFGLDDRSFRMAWPPPKAMIEERSREWQSEE